MVQKGLYVFSYVKDGQGIAKYVREDLNHNPKGRCQEVNTCMNQVKTESNAFVVVSFAK